MPKGSRISLITAMLMGGALCVAARPDLRDAPPWIAITVGLFVGLIPQVGDAITKGLDRLRNPSRKVRWSIAAVLLLASARYFLFSADLADRPLMPQLHDEFMYLLQAKMLAHGRLWMPPHPLGEFFDSFLILVRPVYAAIYFPGAALCYVPGIWLDLSPSATAVIISGLSVSLLYLLMTDLTDGVGGLLAGLLALSLPQWRTLAVATLSHPVVLFLVLATACCLLRWSRSGKIGWIIAAGALAGWAAITRPLDAAVLIAPMSLAAIIMQRRTHWSSGRLLRHIAIAVLAAAPFLALQLIQDRGLTGHSLTTPVAAYDAANFPGMTIAGQGASLAAESPSPLPQVRDYYRSFLRPEFTAYFQHGLLRTWLLDRLPRAAAVSLLSPWLYLLLPFGVISLRTPWQIAVAVGALTVPLAYALVPIYLMHYGLIAAPAFILLVLLACQTLADAFPSAPRLRTAMIVGLAAFALASLPELRGKRDHFVQLLSLADINNKLAALDHRPAVVLFQYRKGNDVHEEPVYNLDAPWPDDCPVIRAQDRGADNHRIFAYYAQRQPDRYFYRYNRGTTELTPLGWARDLAAAPSPP
jgi:4-amino-4-deoxy-L-arabinose transferase-like glycosyltransferase